MIRRVFLALVIASGVLIASYGSPVVPLATPAPSTVWVAGTKGSIQLDMNVLFPPGNGRDLAFQNCTGTCHVPNFVGSVRKTTGRWLINKTSHKGRLPALSDADVETMYEYLTSNFNPDMPLPNLPLELWQTCDQ